jgi:large subunit ribosomal protein L1
MADLKQELEKALEELRKDSKKRKFDQSVDFIINLQKFDYKKSNLNVFVSVPHKVKEKKIAGFLEATNKSVDTIIPEDFKKYSDKKALKSLVNKYDFFIAQASIMPKVATTFGRVLGPTGKMPSPQLGIVANADEKIVNELKNRINHSIKIKIKEPTIKIAIGKESMKDSNLAENAVTVYNAVLKEMPRDKENFKNVEIKFTMTKPQKIKLR